MDDTLYEVLIFGLIMLIAGVVLVILSNNRNIKSLGVLCLAYAEGVYLGVNTLDELKERLNSLSLKECSIQDGKNDYIIAKGRFFSHMLFIDNMCVRMVFPSFEWKFGSIRRDIEAFRLEKKVKEAIEASKIMDEIALATDPSKVADPKRYGKCKPASIVPGFVLFILGGFLISLFAGA